MAKLTRVLQKIFGSTAGVNGITEYGSTAGGATNYTTDPLVMQSARFLTGILGGVLGGTKRLPVAEDHNAINFVVTRQLAYLFQEGIPEYDSTTEYFQKSIVKKTGTYELYGSLVNSNTGNALPAAVSDANWTYLGVLTNLAAAITQLTGEATAGPGSGSVPITLTNAAVIAKVLTGFTAGAGTVASTDSILQAIQKIVGNIAALPTSQLTSVYAPADQAITFGTRNPLTHGLGVVPKVTELFLVCQTAELNYSIGDIVPMAVGMNLQAGAGGNTGLTEDLSTTVVGYRLSDDGYRILNKTTGAVPGAITAANWKVRVRCYA